MQSFKNTQDTKEIKCINCVKVKVKMCKSDVIHRRCKVCVKVDTHLIIGGGKCLKRE